MELTSEDTVEDPFILAGKVGQFELDEFVIVEHPAGSVGVVRRDEGYYAVANRCPHMGAPICVGGGVKLTTAPSQPFHYVTDDKRPVVRCPWHRWEFCLDTGESAGNTTRSRILTYPVKVVGDEVFVGKRANRNQNRAFSGVQ